MKIERTTLVEDIVQEHPDVVEFLMRQGIKCMACGEPLWGTLESVAKEKGFSGEQIDRLTAEIDAMNERKRGEGNANSYR